MNIYKTTNNIKLKYKLHMTHHINDKGCILYFHGGGFIFGNKNDLPKYHIKKINLAGYNIISFDYRFAPEVSFETILSDVIDAINFFINNHNKFSNQKSYYLWGRSAGAFLIFSAILSDKLKYLPKGIISYYGYGFLVDEWYETPSIHYLQYPKIKLNKKDMKKISLTQNEKERFLIYLYGRQNGIWLNIVTNNNVRNFIKKYKIPKNNNIPSTLLVHSYLDHDVPFKESLKLSNLISQSKLLSISIKGHDIDSNTNNEETKNIIQNTIHFLNNL